MSTTWPPCPPRACSWCGCCLRSPWSWRWPRAPSDWPGSRLCWGAGAGLGEAGTPHPRQSPPPDLVTRVRLAALDTLSWHYLRTLTMSENRAACCTWRAACLCGGWWTAEDWQKSAQKRCAKLPGTKTTMLFQFIILCIHKLVAEIMTLNLHSALTANPPRVTESSWHPSTPSSSWPGWRWTAGPRTGCSRMRWRRRSWPWWPRPSRPAQPGETPASCDQSQTWGQSPEHSQQSGSELRPENTLETFIFLSLNSLRSLWSCLTMSNMQSILIRIHNTFRI